MLGPARLDDETEAKLVKLVTEALRAWIADQCDGSHMMVARAAYLAGRRDATALLARDSIRALTQSPPGDVTAATMDADDEALAAELNAMEAADPKLKALGDRLNAFGDAMSAAPPGRGPTVVGLCTPVRLPSTGDLVEVRRLAAGDHWALAKVMDGPSEPGWIRVRAVAADPRNTVPLDVCIDSDAWRWPATQSPGTAE